MNEKNYMSKFELGCIVFNSLIYKLLTRCSEAYSHYGGSAAWLTAVFSGIIFLIVLSVVLKLYAPYTDDGILEGLRRKNRNGMCTLASGVLAVYFVFGICYALYAACSALKTVVYTESPMWFIGGFFVLCAVLTCVFGEKAIRRLHSLNAPGICIALLVIVFLSFRYADTFNMMPILGKGLPSVFGRGLATIFMYSDILVIFLLPKKNANYSFGKTVMWSAVIAVAVNILVVLAINLNAPAELAERFALPLYPLNKTTNLGKISARLDIVYIAALISSLLLYISMALRMILKCVKGNIKRVKKVTVSVMCFALCMTLCGCYDSKEVEEKGYVIALGVDKGESERFRYTFQISNPLESGGSLGAELKAAENSSGKEGNKTVDNVIVEASDYYAAFDKLKGFISKEPDVSHIKLIVYSFEIAESDAMTHSELLLREREVRPGTNMCLAESAEEFLMSVKPTLEESTVRYYELFFGNSDIPYSVTTELRDFVGRGFDKGYDAVMPVAGDSGLNGMGVFSNGNLEAVMNAEDVFVYKLLTGEAEKTKLADGTIVQSDGKPNVSVEIKDGRMIVNIKLYVRAEAEEGANTELYLKNKTESFLYHTSFIGCDVMGLGRYVRKKCLTQEEWEGIDFDKFLKNAGFYVSILTKNVRNIQILQNN